MHCVNGGKTYVQEDGKVTVSITWAGTDITAAKDTVTVTADKATAGTAQDFTQGAYSAGQTAKTIEVSAFTGDTAISIAGTHTI